MGFVGVKKDMASKSTLNLQSLWLKKASGA
jgi:hypothetical protein